MNRLISVTSAASIAMAPLAVARAQTADDGYFKPILMETKGKGPSLQVVRFLVNPEVYETRVNRLKFVSTPTLEAIAS